jgi:F-type H+-transporting ATPase subunit a
MEEKKVNLKMVFLVFFIIQLCIAVLISTKGQYFNFSTFEFEKNEETMSEIIAEDIQTDQYAKQIIQNDPSRSVYEFTYGSEKIYNFFYYLFRKGSPFKWFGEDSAILNFRLWRMLLYLDLFIIIGAFFVSKKLRFLPSKIQICFEFLYTFFESLMNETLGDKAKKFIPYIITLFLFIFISNWSSLIPIPGIGEPTKNLNTPLGLGIMAIMVVYFKKKKKKGIKDYLKGYCEPLVFLLPLNLVGEVAKLVSISFRLFGNIFGGAIICLVVSLLTKNIIVPVGLNMFFTMFAGTIQAFVFTMLSLTYLSIEISD